MKIIILILLSLPITIIAAPPVATMPEITQNFHNVRDFTVHKNEAYFSAQSPMGDISVIVRIEKQNEKWTNPSIATFSGNDHDIEPFISTDGLTLYFASKRPKSLDTTSNDYDLWYVNRKSTTSDWSNAINMGPVVNSEKNEFYPSVSDNGNLYFTANNKDSKGKDDIYFSEFKNGEFQPPYSLSTAINSEGDEYNAYIAADESYLIFGAYKRDDGIGSGDLYISYKNDKNQWSTAANMGPSINTKQMDYCPFVESDTLYFTSKRSELNVNKFNDIHALLTVLNASKNGMSRIYNLEFNPHQEKIK